MTTNSERPPVGRVTTDQIDFFLRRAEALPWNAVSGYREETSAERAVRLIQTDAVRAFAAQLKASSDATESVDQAATRIYHEHVIDPFTPQSTIKIRAIKTLRDLKGLSLIDAKNAIEKAMLNPTD